MNEKDIRNFDLNLLLTLHVLLEEQSVSRAAERLHLSQSAVSHALSRLRETLGDPLFNRGPRGMIPTHRAEALQPEIWSLLLKAGQIIAPPIFDIKKYSGVFRIAATDYGAMIIFPELLRILLEFAPNVTLECHTWNEQTLSQLESGMLDLALGGQNKFSQFNNEALFKDKLVIMVDENHPLALKHSISMEEFLLFPHAIISVVATRMKIIDEILASKNLSRKIIVKIPHFLTAPSMIKNSKILLTIPNLGAKEFIKFGMRLLHFPFEMPEYDYIQVWSSKNEVEPFHLWIRNQIKTICLHKSL